MADAADLKSATFAGVWVRVPLPAPTIRAQKGPQTQIWGPLFLEYFMVMALEPIPLIWGVGFRYEK